MFRVVTLISNLSSIAAPVSTTAFATLIFIFMLWRWLSGFLSFVPFVVAAFIWELYLRLHIVVGFIVGGSSTRLVALDNGKVVLGIGFQDLCLPDRCFTTKFNSQALKMVSFLNPQEPISANFELYIWNFFISFGLHQLAESRWWFWLKLMAW